MPSTTTQVTEHAVPPLLCIDIVEDTVVEYSSNNSTIEYDTLQFHADIQKIVLSYKICTPHELFMRIFRGDV